MTRDTESRNPVPSGPGRTAVPSDSGEGKVLRKLSGLLRDIAACRADLARWDSLRGDLERRLMADLRPLESKMLEIRIDTFRVLGKHLRAGWLGKRDQKQLELALLDLANELEDRFGVDLRADRDRFLEDGRFSESDLGNDHSDEDAEEDGEGGMGGEDPRSSGFRESDFQGKREDRGGPEGSGGPSQAASPPSQREEVIAGDIRALYLMLARALHPDKEADPSRRDEKTAWMQKVTAAYAGRDLAGLLDILGRNPLDAVGPYLSQAPLKTVQGFAKRLRRELEILRARLAGLEANLDPYMKPFLKNGAVNETAYGIHLAETRKDVKFMKQRRDDYRTTQGLQALVIALRTHDWRELM